MEYMNIPPKEPEHQPEDAVYYAGVIKKEHQLQVLKEPTELTPEQIQEKLELMRKMKS